jgi:predicted nucleic acid-binding protein
VAAPALLYLDSSALVKLVLPEAETAALLAALVDWPNRVSSEIATVEVRRAARRASTEEAVRRRADEVLAGLHLLRLDAAILDQAARLEPETLRSLDAIHLASAQTLGADLGGFVVYDRNLAGAARGAGLTVLAPA